MDTQNLPGQTALARTARNNHVEIAQLLLDFKANKDLQDHSGNWVAVKELKLSYHNG